MKEWSKQNEFSSFNSWKGMLYQDHYKAIIARKFLPPIEASLDLFHGCNLSCDNCNASRYLDPKYGMEMRMMPPDHLMNLIKFLGQWGVKGICFGGGGESALHTSLPEALGWTRVNGMEAALITNGTIGADYLIPTLAETCRWVGFSVDAATNKTYKRGKGKDYLPRVLHNMGTLIKIINGYNYNCDVSFKFLIFSYNQHEIYDACKLAKDIGVRDFHVRPADFAHQGMGDLKRTKDLNKKLILSLFEKCHELEDDNFRVFTVLHKFDDYLLPRKDFTQCYAAPLAIQLCANGACYFCLDQRHQEKYLLGYHYPDPHEILNWWGGSRHQQLVFMDTPKDCHSRCTYGPYHRQCEALFTGKDPMCKNFA